MKNAFPNYPDPSGVENLHEPAEEQYKVLIEHSLNAFFLTQINGAIIEANAAASKMFGYSLSEFKNITRQHIIDHKEPDIITSLKQHKKDGHIKFEATGVKKSGEKFPVEIFSVAFTDANGEFKNSAFITDISETIRLRELAHIEKEGLKKDAALLLQNSVESYKYLFNNNPASIIIWNFDNLKITEVNQTAIDLYGFSRKEFLKLTVLDLRAVEDQPAFLEVVKLSKESNFIKRTLRWQHLTKAGTKILMEVTSHPLIYNGEKSVLAMGNDVTQKVQLENSLREERKIRQKQITDAVINGQEKERVEIGQELHDNINQILATTKLYLECALAQENFQRKLITESKMLTEKAMQEIRHLSNALLPPSLEEIGLLEALNDLVENIVLVKPLKLVTNWDNFSEVLLDKKLKLTIFRIVQEQLNNIIKHAEATKATITIVKNEGKIYLTIEDDGIGFNTTKKRIGVGLKNIVSRSEVNNGKVSIQSKPGHGCQIAVCFTTGEI